LKISIITTSFNSQATIAQAIDSVLLQTYPSVEYIIIDGGSTDDTLQVVKSYGDKIHLVVSEPDAGIYDAMNKGIRYATGDVIGILNSDDMYYDSNVLQLVADAFCNQKVDTVYGDVWMSRHANMNIPVRKWVAGKQQSFSSGWHPPHPAVFVKRSCYHKFGSFNTSFAVSGDFELMLRFFEVHQVKAYYLQSVLVNMRMGGESTGSIFNILKGNYNVRRAFISNKIHYPPAYPFKRVIKKIAQYF
jgi:glycosyltransferase involved in cell wall biosynthesis